MYILSMVFLQKSIPKPTRIGRKKITKKLLDKLFNQSHTLIDAYINMGHDVGFRKDIPTRDLNVIYSYAYPRIPLLTEIYTLFSGEYVNFISDYKRIEPNWKKLTKMRQQTEGLGVPLALTEGHFGSVPGLGRGRFFTTWGVGAATNNSPNAVRGSRGLTTSP